MQEVEEVVKDDMAPADAPLGTLRSDLVRFMTDTNTTIKRLVSEFIYELCGNDSKYTVIVCVVYDSLSVWFFTLPCICISFLFMYAIILLYVAFILNVIHYLIPCICAVWTGQEFIRVVGFGSAVGLLHGKGVLENIQRERDAAAALAAKNKSR